MKYKEICGLYEKLFSTTKRLEKTYHTAEFLKKAGEDKEAKENLGKIMLLLQGKVFPSHDERKIGMAARSVLKALNLSTGIPPELIESDWKKTGDLGITAGNLIEKKKQATLFSSPLTIAKVFSNLQKIATIEGAGTVDKKIQLVSELLTSATPIEAKYITRTILEEMRVGLGEGTMRDAITWAYLPRPIGLFFQCTQCKSIVPQSSRCVECHADLDTKNTSCHEILEKKISCASIPLGRLDQEENKKGMHRFTAITTDSPREAYNYIISKVQSAYDLSNDFASVAKAAMEEGIAGLEKIKMKIGTPVKVMLALKETSIISAFERTGKPAALEYKYDGFRMLIHKEKSRVIIYTRRLENVTSQFPEVALLIKEHIAAESAILDGEAVGYDPKTKRYLPFQSISQRIKRKYGIDEIGKKFPVELNLFDIIYYDGKDLLDQQFIERRKILEKVLKDQIERKIVLSKKIITEDEAEAEKFYQESLKEGNEGLMFKTLDAPYKPGARVGYMIKLKSAMDPLDLVITGAEWGEGKRSRWLSSFLIACRDDETDELLEIGRVGTGIKEKEDEKGTEELGQEAVGETTTASETAESRVTFDQMTQLLKPLIISEKGREIKVKPEIVISVLYEEIQKSPTYSSGYALRFPRLVALREDRGINDISTTEEIEELYHSQKGK